LLSRVSSTELAEWSAYEALTGPIGQRRDDMLTAQVVLALVSVFRDPKKGSEPKIEDFIPVWNSPRNGGH
jgi:hypothetical protein